MDAQAYLIRHGWSGPGNPLNPNRRPGAHGGLGLTRPILIARRQNNHGVGKKTTKDPTNQWWLQGFEDALKGVGPDAAKNQDRQNSGAGSGAPVGIHSELYKFFVRGEVLVGSIAKDSEADGSKGTETMVAEGTGISRKRKRGKMEVGNDGGGECWDREGLEQPRSKRDEKRRKQQRAMRSETNVREEESGDTSIPLADTMEASVGGKERSSVETKHVRRRRSKAEKSEKKKVKKEDQRKSRREIAGSIRIDRQKEKRSKRNRTAEDDYPTPAYSEEERSQSDSLAAADDRRRQSSKETNGKASNDKKRESSRKSKKRLKTEGILENSSGLKRETNEEV